jgi:hypothetical protein
VTNDGKCAAAYYFVMEFHNLIQGSFAVRHTGTRGYSRSQRVSSYLLLRIHGYAGFLLLAFPYFSILTRKGKVVESIGKGEIAASWPNILPGTTANYQPLTSL